MYIRYKLYLSLVVHNIRAIIPSDQLIVKTLFFSLFPPKNIIFILGQAKKIAAFCAVLSSS
jgi:hypothetical protein